MLLSILSLLALVIVSTISILHCYACDSYSIISITPKTVSVRPLDLKVNAVRWVNSINSPHKVRQNSPSEYVVELETNVNRFVLEKEAHKITLAPGATYPTHRGEDHSKISSSSVGTEKKGSSTVIVDLFAMLHVADPAFYNQISSIIKHNDYDVVLYELITSTRNIAVAGRYGHRKRLLSKVYSQQAENLASCFGLENQLDFDLQQPNWFVADLDRESLMALETKGFINRTASEQPRDPQIKHSHSNSMPLPFVPKWLPTKKQQWCVEWDTSEFGRRYSGRNELGRKQDEQQVQLIAGYDQLMKQLFPSLPAASRIFNRLLKGLSWLTPCPELGCVLLDWSRMTPFAGGFTNMVVPIWDNIAAGKFRSAQKLAFAQQLVSGVPFSGAFGGEEESNVQVRVGERNKECIRILSCFIEDWYDRAGDVGPHILLQPSKQVSDTENNFRRQETALGQGQSQRQNLKESQNLNLNLTAEGGPGMKTAGEVKKEGHTWKHAELRVAVLYGVYHISDLTSRLQSELGMRQVPLPAQLTPTAECTDAVVETAFNTNRAEISRLRPNFSKSSHNSISICCTDEPRIGFERGGELDDSVSKATANMAVGGTLSSRGSLLDRPLPSKLVCWKIPSPALADVPIVSSFQPRWNSGSTVPMDNFQNITKDNIADEAVSTIVAGDGVVDPLSPSIERIVGFCAALLVYLLLGGLDWWVLVDVIATAVKAVAAELPRVDASLPGEGLVVSTLDVFAAATATVTLEFGDYGRSSVVRSILVAVLYMALYVQRHTVLLRSISYSGIQWDRGLFTDDQ